MRHGAQLDSSIVTRRCLQVLPARSPLYDADTGATNTTRGLSARCLNGEARAPEQPLGRGDSKTSIQLLGSLGIWIANAVCDSVRGSSVLSCNLDVLVHDPMGGSWAPT